MIGKCKNGVKEGREASSSSSSSRDGGKCTNIKKRKGKAVAGAFSTRRAPSFRLFSFFFSSSLLKATRRQGQYQHQH